LETSKVCTFVQAGAGGSGRIVELDSKLEQIKDAYSYAIKLQMIDFLAGFDS
jgi:hypothetical protein